MYTNSETPPRDRLLLGVDGVVNLLLGVVLLAFPDWLVRALGAPPFATRFYPTILGGVLTGIGVALFLEVRRRGRGPVGLGIAGAIVINILGSGVLALWLVAASSSIEPRGRIILWAIAAVVLGIAAAEIAVGGLRDRPESET